MCDEKILYYNTVTQSYSFPQKVVIQDKCNGFTIRNAGNSILIMDDEQIQPGESKAIGGNRNEYFVGRKDISFAPQAVQPAPRIDLCYVTQKYYVDRKGPTDPNLNHP